MTTFRRSFVLAVLAAAAIAHAGCGEDSKLQDKLKGLWVLQTRTTSGGKELIPPEVSVRVEWFAMDPTHGHMSFMATRGLDDTQVLGAHYSILNEATFERTVYLAIGGGINPTFVPGMATENTTDRGDVVVAGTRGELRHDSGLSMVFDGSTLTLTHTDGTVDILTK